MCALGGGGGGGGGEGEGETLPIGEQQLSPAPLTGIECFPDIIILKGLRSKESGMPHKLTN